MLTTNLRRLGIQTKRIIRYRATATLINNYLVHLKLTREKRSIDARQLPRLSCFY